MPPRHAQKKHVPVAAPPLPRVLIVEDDEPIMHALIFKLEQMHIATDMAYDGEMAIKKIRERAWDVVIADILLPKKDGFAVLDAIRSEPWSAHAAVFVFSNLSKAEHIRRVQDLGARDFIEKTKASLGDITEKIAQALHESPAS